MSPLLFRHCDLVPRALRRVRGGRDVPAPQDPALSHCPSCTASAPSGGFPKVTRFRR
jgi:hypothetical protein